LSKRRKAILPAALGASRWWTLRGLRTRACTESSCARTGRAHRPPILLIMGWVAQGTRRRYA
jgi:hypothetical protein